MRKDPLVTGNYYHIYNRGVDKRDIFMDKTDLDRFILSIVHFNQRDPIGSIEKVLVEYAENSLELIREVENTQPLVSIVCFTLNPNHFHFIVKQEIDGGISEFFKRLLGGYTNYFNKTHDRSGALFQGRFKSNLIKNDAYELRIYPYVHMNHKVHDIPIDKIHLIYSSENEYNTNNFQIVSENEANELLMRYGGVGEFNMECLNVVNQIRKERGKKIGLLDDDPIPK